MAALPLDDFRVTVMVDYKAHGYGSQHMSMNHISEFASEIASSRTFCFAHEIPDIVAQALGQGGSMHSGLVLVGKGLSEAQRSALAKRFGADNPILQPPNKDGLLGEQAFRSPNELVRHKLMDVIGDLSLLGKPLKAQLVAIKPGHAANVAFAKKLRKHAQTQTQAKDLPEYNPNVPPVLDINKIQQILPHRFPFLFVDEIFHLDKQTIAGIKNLSYNEHFFQGHFPNNPVMPGVMQIEVLAQVGAILLQNLLENPEDYWTYFMGVRHFRFKKLIIPGKTLIVYCKLLGPIRHGIGKMSGQGYINGQLACEGEIISVSVRKDL